jgi:hypothetical protein
VVNQEVEECDEQIDFDPEVIGNSRLSSENEARWQVLLKGLGSTSFGKRYNPMELASKMIRDIETKDERYVAYQPLTKQRSAAQQTISYINIVDFFKKHYTASTVQTPQP